MQAAKVGIEANPGSLIKLSDPQNGNAALRARLDARTHEEQGRNTLAAEIRAISEEAARVTRDIMRQMS